MPRFAANLTMLFTEVPFLDRFGLAASAGFRGVEFLFPYAYPVRELHSRLIDSGLELVLHNLPSGDWGAGERGIACHPNRVEEFRKGVAEAISYAEVLGVKQLNCLVGKKPAGIEVSTLRSTLIGNLRYAALELKSAGIDLLLEPINKFDVPDFLVDSTAKGLDIIKEVGASNLFLQYDIYHAQRMEGELSETLRRNFEVIKHIQVADNPGRNEPGTGEINYPYLFRLLDELGYTGWVGCEYIPASSTAAGLHWLNLAGN